MKKKLGQFFTPVNLAKTVTNLTLNSDLKKLQKTMNSNNFFNYLKNLKILEPSFGTGVFLEEFVKILLNYYKMYIKDYNEILHYINNNIYGIEFDNNLYLETKEKLKIRYGIKFFNLYNQDFLRWNTETKFNYIIGNPPYITFNNNKYLTKEYKSFLLNNYKTVYKIYDIYGCFVEKSINLLANNGKLGFIIPITYLTNESFSKLRNYIIKRTNIKNIILIDKKEFNNININLNILILQKILTKKINIKNYFFKDNKLKFISNIRNEEYFNYNNFNN